jgi:hypothetical protein
VIDRASLRPCCVHWHATCDRDQAIAKALGTFARDVQNAAEEPAEDPEPGERGLSRHPIGLWAAAMSSCHHLKMRASGDSGGVREFAALLRLPVWMRFRYRVANGRELLDCPCYLGLDAFQGLQGVGVTGAFLRKLPQEAVQVPDSVKFLVLGEALA